MNPKLVFSWTVVATVIAAPSIFLASSFGVHCSQASMVTGAALWGPTMGLVVSRTRPWVRQLDLAPPLAAATLIVVVYAGLTSGCLVGQLDALSVLLVPLIPLGMIPMALVEAGVSGIIATYVGGLEYLVVLMGLAGLFHLGRRLLPGSHRRSISNKVRVDSGTKPSLAITTRR